MGSLFQVGGSKDEEDSRGKDRRGLFADGRSKDRGRGSLFQMVGAKTQEWEVCSRLEAAKTRKIREAKTEEGEVCCRFEEQRQTRTVCRWEGQRQRKGKSVSDGRGKDRGRGSLFQIRGAKTDEDCLQMEGAKTEEEEVCSRFEGQRPKKRKCVPDGTGKNRGRGSLFQMGGAKTEEACSRWEGQRQKEKSVPDGRDKDRGRGSLFQKKRPKTKKDEVRCGGKGQTTTRIVPDVRAKEGPIYQRIKYKTACKC